MIIKKLSDMKRGLYGIRGAADAKTATFDAKTATFVAVGNFDGMHLGHMTLIRSMLQAAREQRVPGVVFTFENYTKADTPQLMSTEERNRLFSKLGVDYLILGNFDELRGLSAEEFTDTVLIKKCRCKNVYCGYNFRFGRSASADAETLRALMRARGGDAVILPPVTAGEQAVSSTLIRNYITDGEAELANQLLPAPFSVTAPVERGKQLGRRLGMPTVNQYFPKERVIPLFGVYAAAVRIGKTVYPAVTNVGIRPTVDDGDRITCESYLFNFSGNAYGKAATASLLKFLRPEMKFPSIEALRRQVEEDKKNALRYFSEKTTVSGKEGEKFQ